MYPYFHTLSKYPISYCERSETAYRQVSTYNKANSRLAPHRADIVTLELVGRVVYPINREYLIAYIYMLITKRINNIDYTNEIMNTADGVKLRYRAIVILIQTKFGYTCTVEM